MYIFLKKSKELLQNEVKLTELESDFNIKTERNSSLSKELSHFEKKSKELAKNFDIRLRTRESQLLEIIEINRMEIDNLQKILQEKEEFLINHSKTYEKILKSLNFINLSLETDIASRENIPVEENMNILLEKLHGNFYFWKDCYEQKIEHISREITEMTIVKEKEHNQYKNLLEKMKIKEIENFKEIESLKQEKSAYIRKNNEIEALKNENTRINEKSQIFVEKINYMKTVYNENEKKMKEKITFLEKKIDFLENNHIFNIKAKIKLILEKFHVFFKEIKEELALYRNILSEKGIFQDFVSNISKIKDFFKEQLEETKEKNSYKLSLLEENIEKINNFYIEKQENLIKKHKIDYERVVKEKDEILMKNEELKQENSILHEKQVNGIVNFEEKLKEITSDIELLQRTHQLEKEQLINELMKKTTNEEDFDKNFKNEGFYENQNHNFYENTEEILKKNEEFQVNKEKLNNYDESFKIIKNNRNFNVFNQNFGKNDKNSTNPIKIKNCNENDVYSEKYADFNDKIKTKGGFSERQVFSEISNTNKENYNSKTLKNDGINQKELSLLKGKMFEMEKMIEKITNFNNFDKRLGNRIKCIKENIEQFEEIDNRNTTKDGFSFEVSPEDHEISMLESEKIKRIKRFSLGGVDKSTKMKFF